MAIKTAKEVLKEIEEARQHLESLTMVLDGAQAKFIVESMLMGLQATALAYVETRGQDSFEWNNEYGSRSEVCETSRELGLTAISAIRTFVEALPNELTLMNVNLIPLTQIEEIFEKG